MSSPPFEPASQRIARRLRAARLQRALTVREVAAALKLADHTQIVRYENGQTQPSLDRLEQLAYLYNLTLAALVVAEDALIPAIVELERDWQEVDRDT
jgi:transcriptional regulator with XRE-family HTH domain